MSSLRLVPPVLTIIWMFGMYLAKSLRTAEVWSASSLVGTKTRACILSFVSSIRFSNGITKAAVFPVPFFARTITFFPSQNIGTVKNIWNNFFLNWGWGIKSFSYYPHMELFLELEVLPIQPFSICNIFCFGSEIRGGSSYLLLPIIVFAFFIFADDSTLGGYTCSLLSSYFASFHQ